MNITTEFIKKQKDNCTVFVETGTFMGDTTNNAYRAIFNEIHTLELSERYYSAALRRFKDCRNLYVHLGDSSKILGLVISNINANILFWLDGHYSGNSTAKGIKNCPLIEELEHIKNHPIKTHIIMVDDIRLQGTEWIISLEEIKNKILEINKDYKFYLVDSPLAKEDILIAKIN